MWTGAPVESDACSRSRAIRPTTITTRHVCAALGAHVRPRQERFSCWQLSSAPLTMSSCTSRTSSHHGLSGNLPGDGPTRVIWLENGARCDADTSARVKASGSRVRATRSDRCARNQPSERAATRRRKRRGVYRERLRDPRVIEGTDLGNNARGC